MRVASGAVDDLEQHRDDGGGTEGGPTSLGDAFTLTDAAEALGVAADAARGTLSTLVRAGTVGRLPGTSGLRFVRRT